MANDMKDDRRDLRRSRRRMRVAAPQDQQQAVLAMADALEDILRAESRIA
jgi:hypothetical protein